LGSLDDATPDCGLPGRGECVVQALSLGFNRADHPHVVNRAIPISRQEVVSNAALREVDDGSAHDTLDASQMIGWDSDCLVEDCSEQAA
jgi:hypothetical protein